MPLVRRRPPLSRALPGAPPHSGHHGPRFQWRPPGGHDPDVRRMGVRNPALPFPRARV